MLAFIFPGQGSQKRGMGQGLFDEIDEFRSIETAIDQCLGYSIRKLCLEDPENRLKETQYTQPAMYVVNALHYYKAISQGMRPDVAAGHSVGEYNALLAAGAFDFLTGVRLIKKRGELMARAKNGGMAAVVGLSISRITQVIKENGFIDLDIANYNTSNQTVLSGPVDQIKRAASAFEKAGAQLYLPLAVSAAFHSRYMVDAAREFSEFLTPFSFHELQIPVIANVTGGPYPYGDPAVIIKSLLAKQISSSVLWAQSIRYLITKGVTTFKELGSGTVLTKIVQQIQAEPMAHAAAAGAGAF